MSGPEVMAGVGLGALDTALATAARACAPLLVAETAAVVTLRLDPAGPDVVAVVHRLALDSGARVDFRVRIGGGA